MKRIIILSFVTALMLDCHCANKEASEPGEEMKKEVGPPPEENVTEFNSRADEAAAEFLDQMHWGNTVFNVPRTMQLFQTAGIQLLLSPSQTIEELERRIEEEGARRHQRVRISRIMLATLKGAGFNIQPITEAIQVVNPAGETEWKWDITAIESGPQRLHLTLNAILQVDGQDRPKTLETMHEIIEVQVSLEQQVSSFVSENWKWLWSAILVPFLGWLWERRKKKSKA